MGRGRVAAEVELRPTEDEEKVLRALMNVFEPQTIERVDMKDYVLIRGLSDSLASLQRLHKLLRQQEVLEAARAYMIRAAREGSLTLLLHKQAAYEGKVSLLTWDQESPLGPLRITINYSGDIREVIDWLAPATAHGRPLWERPMPDP